MSTRDVLHDGKCCDMVSTGLKSSATALQVPPVWLRTGMTLHEHIIQGRRQT